MDSTCGSLTLEGPDLAEDIPPWTPANRFFLFSFTSLFNCVISFNITYLDIEIWNKFSVLLYSWLVEYRKYGRLSGIGRGMNWCPLIYQLFLTLCMAKQGRRLTTWAIPWWGIWLISMKKLLEILQKLILHFISERSEMHGSSKILEIWIWETHFGRGLW